MKYNERITLVQKEVLLQFMEEHVDFARGNLLGPENRNLKKKMWKVLTRMLNECDSPTKTTAKWQRVWAGFKNKIQTKAEYIRRRQRAAGGGYEFNPQLTVFEERLMAMLTPEAVHGLQDPSELSPDSPETRHSSLEDSDVEVLMSRSPPPRPSAESDDEEKWPSTTDAFRRIAEATNEKIDGLTDALHELVAEKSQTNALLRELIETFKE